MTAMTEPQRRGTAVGWLSAAALGAWQGLRLRDAALLTVAPLVAVAYLVASSVQAYRAARKYDDWFSRDITVAKAFSDRAHAALRMPGALALAQRFTPAAHDAGIIRLAIPGPAWDTVLATDVPVWDHWVHGTLEYGGTNIPIRTRKRGDFSVHWLTDKRSITVRTPRDQFYKTFRSFGLSAKTPIESFVANRLAGQFGLLVPRTDVVPVFLNNRFYGMYRLVEPVDESFLRPLDRMPGNIFRGDRAARGEYFKGQNRNLFANPYIWDRAAVSDRPTGAGAGQLRLLLDDLAGGTFASHQRAMTRFDRDEVARLISYLLVVGDPNHMDGVHNQLLYEDPSTQLLHPIPWDIRLRPLDAPDITLNDLMQEWLRDPLLVDQLMRYLAGAIADPATRNAVDSLAHGVEQRYAAYFDYDRRRGGLIPDVGSAQNAVATVDHNLALLASWLGDDTVAVGAAAAAGEVVLDLETRGRVGVDLMGLGAAGAPRLYRDANLNGIHDPSDPEVPLRPAGPGRWTLATPLPLYAGVAVERTPGLVKGHVPYRLFVRGAAPGGRVRPALRNRVTGAAAATVTWEAGAVIRPSSAWHPWRYPEVRHQLHRLAGAVRLTETLTIPAGDTLVIAPGTTIRMAPEVSIISKGLVIARGTAAQPIRIFGDVPGKPWGTVAFFGPGADSSVLAHADVSAGGGALVDRVEYTGMVNVHRARGLIFDHVVFRDNVRSDDTFHALHASVTISNSQFLRANGDAIDFDISTGTISNNVISNSVNDAIDLMTSTPWIVDNVISGSGDKGISIGEASRPIVFNNRIHHCVRGIEAKDRSEPLVLNNDIDSNGVALRERRKNWRYGGGPFATILATTFRSSGPVLHDPLSRWTLWRSAGLDSAEERSPSTMTDAGWLYRSLGIRVDTAVTGRVGHWTRIAPVPPLDAQHFEDDFGAWSDGWVPAGGTTRLEKRDLVMVMEVERTGGSAARAVQWDLPAGGEVIVQASGRDLASGRLVAVSETGEVAVPLSFAAAPTSFRFAALILPPGRYHSLRIEVEPRPGLSHTIQRKTGLSVLRAGRLAFRGYALYPLAR